MLVLDLFHGGRLAALGSPSDRPCDVLLEITEAGIGEMLVWRQQRERRRTRWSIVLLLEGVKRLLRRLFALQCCLGLLSKATPTSGGCVWGDRTSTSTTSARSAGGSVRVIERNPPHVRLRRTHSRTSTTARHHSTNLCTRRANGRARAVVPRWHWYPAAAHQTCCQWRALSSPFSWRRAPLFPRGLADDPARPAVER